MEFQSSLNSCPSVVVVALGLVGDELDHGGALLKVSQTAFNPTQGTVIHRGYFQGLQLVM